MEVKQRAFSLGKAVFISDGSRFCYVKDLTAFGVDSSFLGVLLPSYDTAIYL